MRSSVSSSSAPAQPVLQQGVETLKIGTNLVNLYFSARDKNGFITRPAPIGTVADHYLQAYYLGWTGDGHIGWLNIDHAFYQVLGEDSLNGIAGRRVDINGQMAALEVSVDKNWMRHKLSVFYASGDDNPTDSHATGFDTVLDRQGVGRNGHPRRKDR